MTSEIPSDFESTSESESHQARTISGFWRRILALLIDSIVIGIVGIILGLLFFDQFAHLGVWGRLVGFSVTLLYFGLLNSHVGKGQTIGKRIVKIKVIDRDGRFTSVPRSLLRSSVLEIPFFLNGAMIPPSLLMTPVGLLINLLIFGFGGAIIYLYIFNAKTRQSLHDLIAGTYVVSASSSLEVYVPAIWKGHLYVTGAWIVLSIVFALVLTRLATSGGRLTELLNVQRSIMNSGKVHMASVFVGQRFGSDGSLSYLSTGTVWKSEPHSFEQAEREIASIVLSDYPDALNKDAIVVTVVYGYDIGISSTWRSATDQASPAEWMARIRTSSER